MTIKGNGMHRTILHMLAYYDVVPSSVLLTVKNSKITNTENKCLYNRTENPNFGSGPTFPIHDI
jgi:hypothetical protein